MKLESLTVGLIGTNCYLLWDESAGNAAAIVDPGGSADLILNKIKQEKLDVKMILLTHGHFDHYTAVEGLLEKWPELPVYINEKDVTDRHTSGFALLFPRLPEKNQRYYKEDDVLSLGSLAIRVMETAGHSRGSVCLLVGDTIFSGDTLFCGSCGRTDFAGGSYEDMLQSLKRLAMLPGQYRVYPGHDRPTDLDFERRFNPYMKQGLRE